MKIEIEVSDLTNFISGLNNAMVCYLDIINSISVGCDPSLLTKNKVALEAIGEEELKKRWKELLEVYLQLSDMERRLFNDKRRENYEKNE